MFKSIIITLLLTAGVLAAYENLGDQVEGHVIQDFFDDKRVISLSMAAAKGEKKTISALLAQGVDINHTGKDNMTPLMWAFGARNKIGFRVLLENGANPNIVVRGEGSVLTFTANVDDPWYLKVALQHGGDPNFYHAGRKQSILIDTVSPGKLSHIKLLLEAGADINETDARGETALMAAASLNQFDIVYYLLQQGADYRISNNWGKTIVDRIERNLIDPNNKLYEWRAKVITFLREQGVKVSTRES